MNSKVSVRGQTVIPNEVRKQLGITENTILEWKVKDGLILVYPLPPDPVRASVGILKGEGSFEEFLQERNAERANELAAEIEQ